MTPELLGTHAVRWRGIVLLVTWTEDYLGVFPAPEYTFDHPRKADAWAARESFESMLIRGGAGKERALRLILEAPRIHEP